MVDIGFGAIIREYFLSNKFKLPKIPKVSLKYINI